MKSIRLFLFLLGCLLLFPVCNAFSAVQQEYGDYYGFFKNISLPHDANVTTCVVQDSDGFVWIGSKKGLLKYNGYEAQRYIYNQEENFTDQNSIQTMILFDHDHLLLGTDAGLLLFNIHTSKYEVLPEALRRLPAIRGLKMHGTLLGIGTRENGFYVYDIPSGRLTQYSSGHDGETFIRSITFVGNRVFVGSHLGLCSYDMHTRRRQLIMFSNQHLPHVHAMLHDVMTNTLLIGTEEGMYHYDLRTHYVSKLPIVPNGIVQSLCMDAHQNLIMGTEDGLYIRQANGQLQHFVHDVRNAHSLCNNVIRYVNLDRDGNLWIATFHGMSVSTMIPWYRQTFLSQWGTNGYGNMLNTILMDRQGRLWMGGDNGLILRMPSGEVVWYHQHNVLHPLQVNQIRTIYEDRDGDIWIGTDASVARLNPRTNQFVYYRLEGKNGRSSRWTYGVLEDDNGRIWLTTFMGGLFIIDKQRLIATPPGTIIFDDGAYLGKNKDILKTIYQIEDDGAGHFWANSANGLLVIDTHSLNVNVKSKSIDNLLYANGSIWYSNTGKIYRLTLSSGRIDSIPIKISSGSVFAFVHDDKRVWFSCIDGVFAIDGKTNAVRQYSLPPGYYKSAFFWGDQYSIIWGGEDCVTAVNIAAVPQQTGRRRVVIAKISSSAKEILLEGISNDHHRIDVNDGTNVVIELSTLNYFPQNNETFYYKLDNGEWESLPQGQNKLVFAELGYGKKTLSLSATNPSIDNQAVISQYTLYVDYPWFLSWWAILIYILLLVLVLYLVRRYQYQKVQTELKHLERQKALTLAKLKMDFFVNVSYELKSPLRLIINPMSKIIAASKQSKQRVALQSVYMNVLRLNSILNKVIDFRQMEYENDDTMIPSQVEMNVVMKNCIHNFESSLAQRHINLTFHSEVEEAWMNVDIFKIETVINNLLSNAIKYCNKKDGNIEVSLKQDNTHFYITVHDNGEGIHLNEKNKLFLRFFQGANEPETIEGNGVGLYLVKKFVELHHGSVDIENRGGACVTICLPLGEREEDEESSQVDSTQCKRNEQPSLLVVTDDKTCIHSLKAFLSDDFMLFFGKDEPELYQLLKEQDVEAVLLDLDVFGEHTVSSIPKIQSHSRRSILPVMIMAGQLDDIPDGDMDQLDSYPIVAKPLDGHVIKPLVSQLLSFALSNMVDNSTSENEPDITVNEDDRLMEMITEIIATNMGEENFGVNELAAILDINTKQLYRKMKQITGYTPIAYIKRLRMKRAASLLSNQKITISEVMYLVGYSNASYFTKCFTQEFGKTPKEWMNEKSKE